MNNVSCYRSCYAICRILCHFGSRDCRRVVTSMLLACISVIDNDFNFTDLLLSKAIDTSFIICFNWQWWKIFCIHDLEYVIAVQFLLYCNRRSFRDITKLCAYIFFFCLFGSTVDKSKQDLSILCKASHSYSIGRYSVFMGL